jgi:glycine dehydrogenase subunit 2
MEPLIFELSCPGRIGHSLPEVDTDDYAADLPTELRRESLDMPELSELDVMRHFVRLSQLNYSIDSGFYPLGSCTMKYNPKINEDAAALPGFYHLHPMQPEYEIQGALQIQYELQEMLKALTGMDACTLQPAAGAHGEFTGMALVRAYHRSRGDAERNLVLIPDSAHGTNPATCTALGMTVVSLKTGTDGNVDMGVLARALQENQGKIAGMMITIPSTLGIFEPNIVKIADLLHEAGALLYCDGANMNAMVGEIRPGDLGVDVLHINLHKTFTTPHGGGGPGSGPVACKSHLAPFLPTPLIAKEGDRYVMQTPEQTIGKVRAFWGNFGMHIRAYTYIRQQGASGLKMVSRDAVLNANYIRSQLKDTIPPAQDRPCMHEVVLTGKRLKQETGVKTLDVVKRLMDYGYHAPTIYFPLIVEECMLIEPTETESRETMDGFIAAMKAIVAEAHSDPELVKSAPHHTQLGRLDEVTAAREPKLRWLPSDPRDDESNWGSGRNPNLVSKLEPLTRD